MQDRWNLKGDPGGIASYYNNSFDMRGHSIPNVALSWKPWLEVGTCHGGPKSSNKGSNTNCETAGVLKELMDNFGQIYNFTWTVDKPTDGKWGTIPKTSSKQNRTASDYFGALGALVRKEYDLALSVWGSTPERRDIMDFTMAIAHVPKVIVINQNSHPWDLTLFIRVFTVQSWVATMLCLSILMPVLSFILWSKVAKKATLSKRVAVLSGWLMFILLSSYYSGALTMFFSSIPSIPFQTIQEGLEKNWEMVLQNGMHLYPMELAQPVANCKVCQDWAARHSRSPGTLIMDSFDEMLDKLSRTNKAFTFVEVPTFIIDLKTKPRPDFTPQQIGQVIPHTAHMVLWKNSPLLPMMNQGILRMLQCGSFDILTKRFDTYIPVKEELATKSVRTDHVLLIFSSFALCLLAILIILGGEILHRKLSNLNELRPLAWK